MKRAVFVEGLAEQIFVREFLIKYFDFDGTKLRLECVILNAGKFDTAPYNYGSKDAENYFLVINSQGDNKAFTSMLNRVDGLVGAGFDYVMCLRDMFCQNYKKMSPHFVSTEINQKFISVALDFIGSKKNANKMCVCFAIMEVEAWMLALVEKWKGNIPDDVVKKYIELDNIEQILHPTEVIKKITSGSNKPYDKHEDQVNSILGNISRDDFMGLYKSNRCPSFNLFIDRLLS